MAAFDEVSGPAMNGCARNSTVCRRCSPAVASSLAAGSGAGRMVVVALPFHIMAKPTGSACNLECRYCYYLEKARFTGAGLGSHKRLDGERLEAFIRDYIASQDAEEITFAWQGGEPTLLGTDYFREVVALQRRHCPPGKRIANALQTNGTLLDDAWCRFFKEHGFLIGLSIDGPAALHDAYRVDRGGRPTHARVMQGLGLLRQHGVEFNTLTVVSKRNSREPEAVYTFLRKHGSGFMQFIPLVERRLDPARLATPPAPDHPELGDGGELAPWSVQPADWGVFLNTVFDLWLKRDVGRVFVQLFDVQLALHMGLPSPLCVFSEECGRGLALEQDGGLYACDHYVYPEYRIGTVGEAPLGALVDSPRQREFGRAKRTGLPGMCRRCPDLPLCHGECPKHRILKTPEGEPGLNALCAGYRAFFRHSRPAFRQMAALVRSGRPAADVMRR